MESEINITPSQPKPNFNEPKLKIRPIILLVILGVVIAGYFVSAEFLFFSWPFELPISIPTFTPHPTFTPNQNQYYQLSSSPRYDKSLESWPIYHNEKYGFEVKYPKGWLILEGTGKTEGIITFRNQNDTKSVGIEKTENQERIAFIKAGEADGYVALDSGKWSVYLHRGENPGELGDFRNTLALVINHGNQTYIIRLTPNDNFIIFDLDFNQIISTFKFLP